jgi:hypothetical protein
MEPSGAAGAGSAGAGAAPGMNEGASDERTWTHAEGGAANLAEQDMDSCLRVCSVLDQVFANDAACEPGTRMRRGVIYDDDEVPSELPDVVINPECYTQCEEDIAANPGCPAVIEWSYCTSEAEFICGADARWFWNDCYELDPVCE